MVEPEEVFVRTFDSQLVRSTGNNLDLPLAFEVGASLVGPSP